MIDLDATVRSLIEGGASRGAIFRELDALATGAVVRANRFARGKMDQRYRADEERMLVARIRRILFFIHHGVPTDRASDADHQLYDLLKKIEQ